MKTRGITAPIIREKKPDKVTAALKCGIHNRFDIEVIDIRTGEVRQRAQAENVICSQMWARMFNSSYSNQMWNAYIHYGTGSGTPSASDTSLFTFLGYGTPSTSNDVYTTDMANGVVSVRRKIQLSETTAVGSTLSEVGIAYGTSSSTLCTHAMLKDMNGNTITITKTATDIINIYATVFCHFSASGYDSGSIMISSRVPAASNNNFKGWLLGTGYYDSTDALATTYGGTSVAMSASSSTFTFYFSSSAKTLTLTAARVAASAANVVGGIGGIAMRYIYNDIYLFAGGSWYPSSSVTGEAIGTGDGSTVDFKTDFGNVSAATVYVDGTAVSATFDTSPYYTSNMEYYFRAIESGGCLHYSGNTISTKTKTAGTTYYYYNPNYSLGIATITSFDSNIATLYTSDDLETWTSIGTGSGTFSVPTAQRHAKYWKRVDVLTGYDGPSGFVAADVTTNNLHLASAPASGAVVTADYTTKTIAKDTNHVFDLSVTIQLGEYSA